MLGHRVELKLINPSETIDGELRKQLAEGVYIYTGWAENAGLRFYPMHRIWEMRDLGEVPR